MEPSKTRFVFTMLVSELEAWRKAAKQAGLTLAVWLRQAANEKLKRDRSGK